MTVAQQCADNTSQCPNGQDGVSRTFLQCDSWSHQFVQQNCPAGQVCYANPNKPGTAMCGLPGTGGQGKCTGNTAKCVSPGQTGDYLQCESWSGQYVNAKCPSGQKCHNNSSNTGVFCQ
ncbi:hypothetical protein H4R20_000864 [Coemansia guatemalensis]|uniref:Uncharacterized protein n=1 Tax=Coemansia guatemalensis TaxID=2761395 RepID=A0A9W8HYE8_9FUNG|nr:hypothetical protein H4R20_000864 [Coemansia guatemalensis]